MKTKLLVGTILSTVGMAAPALAAQAAPAVQTPPSVPPADPAAPAATASDQQQAPDANTASTPGEIVVTAQKRSERLQDIPVAVSVVSGAALETAARPSIESATQLVPALNFLKSGTTLNQTIFLRGVGTASFSIAGEPSVSTIVDGVVYARSGEAFSDLIDVDQLEVLRGPQGTLFGKNASAGVINIITKQPTARPGGTLEASYFTGGSEMRVRGAINVPLSKDLLTRFTGFYGHYDGNIRNVAHNNDRVNGYKHYGVRGQLLYRPDSGLRVLVIGDYHKNNDDCCAEVIATGTPVVSNGVATGFTTTAPIFSMLPTPLGDKTRTINQDLITRTKEKGWGVSGQVDVPVGNDTFTSITAYRKWDNTEIRDGDWLPRAYVGFNQLHDFGPQTSSTLSQEVRLTSPSKQLISYVLGGYYSRAKSERIFTRNDVVCTAATGAPTGVLIPCGGTGANPSTTPSGTADFGSTFRNVAVFGQGVLNASDRFRVVAGLRYTKDRLSVFHKRVSTGLNVNSAGQPTAAPGIQPNFDQGVFDRYNQLIASGSTVAAALAAAPLASNGVPFRTKTSSSNVSGKAALQYDFSRDIMGYVSYTRGYKGPAYNIFYNLTATGTNRIDPETSNSYEVGIKNTFLGGRLVLNLDAFYAKYNNFQANNPDLVAGVVVTRFTNAGTVSTRGVEADLIWRPLDDLTVSGGVAYTDATVDKFNAPPGAASTAIIPPFTPLGYAPKWKGSLTANYHVRTGGPVDVYLGASGNAQSSQLALFAADPVQRQLGTIKSYSIVNASIGVGDAADHYRVTFQVRNLFDTSYAAAITNGGPSGSYRYQIPRDADRYYGVTARMNF
ncbi:TonB-dependent receptor [Sphingomonas sp. KRR8]|uniref:TonB-dependent receptor n=1 Tax=Sphingomonas sp. KRR8 TaxID=2942996 RepID=UPI0020204A48|nr:TonB-dependent receptor [Sphingomonas sp. KRR8]URD59883.1 TonB-dependent receptor [Sphingomonas sp. KRR8]